MAVNVDYVLFFTFPTTPPLRNKDCVARCKTCSKNYKYTLTTKGNLLKHLQTSHGQQLNQHRAERQQLRKSDQHLLAADGSVRKKQDFKNQDKIVTSIVRNLCGHGGIALQVVEQPWFRSFMADVEPRFVPVSRVAVKRKLTDIYTQDRQVFLNNVTTLKPKPTVTADFWTGRDGRSFMGCTIHYIIEGNLKNNMLFFKEVPPPHTSCNIRNRFEDELDRLKVLCFKVVTDNAANMKCVFTMEVEESAETSTEDLPDDGSDEIDDSSTIIDDELNLSHHWERQPLTHFDGWVGCAAHQIQLVVHDGYKELLNYRRVQAAFKKAKAICTLSHRSSHFRYAFKGRIPVPNETRWNSHQKMHEYILKHADAINSALENCDHSTLMITTVDKENLKGVTDVMQYFAEATDILQRDNKPTCNRVIPVVDSLENAIKSVSREKAAINAMCEALQNSLERRFSYLLDSAIHQAATALDSRVKLSFTNNTTNHRKFFLFQSTTVKKNILELLSEESADSTTGTATNSGPNAVLQPPRKKKLLDFSSILPTNNSLSEIEIELQTYFDCPVLDIAPIPFWSGRNITQLSTLALQLCSVPCSSASVERLFSKAGLVLSQRRTRLQSSDLEQLLFYK